MSFERQDNTTRQTYFYDDTGNLVDTQPYTPEENALADAEAAASTEVGNELALLAKVPQAIQTNNAFLAITSPTNAQVVTQVKVLTRQVTALMKLVAHDLMDTSGT